MDRLLKDITEHAQVEFGPRMEAIFCSRC